MKLLNILQSSIVIKLPRPNTASPQRASGDRHGVDCPRYMRDHYRLCCVLDKCMYFWHGRGDILDVFRLEAELRDEYVLLGFAVGEGLDQVGLDR